MLESPIPRSESKLPTSFPSSSDPVSRVPTDGMVSIQVPEREAFTVDELVRSRASLGSSQPVISYPSKGIEYIDYPLHQLDIYAFRVAKAIGARIPPRTSSSETPAVIALLGPSDLNYLVLLLALSKLGHSILFLSTRISLEAYASLLEKTGSKHIFIHESFEDTAAELKERLPELQVNKIPPKASYDYPVTESDDYDTSLTSHLDLEKESKYIAFIVHSSGSTGLPKPIFQAQGAAIKNYAGNMNMSGFITLPLYHNHGISCLFRTVHSCKTLHLYNADLPLTKQYLLDIMREHKFEIFYGVPYALKLLAESDEGIAVLAEFKAVMFGGSACPDSLGDRLVDNDVNLISHYGTTETGQLMTSFRPREDKQWDYVRPSAAVKPFLQFEERSPGIFELICLDGWPSKVMSNRPNGSYATKDLFVKHPTLEAYKYYARLDDTIVLVNGEKVNPLDMEGSVRQHDAVSEAVVFGAGRSSIGLAVIRAPGTDALSDEGIVERIWPAVERAHEAMPAHGQLSRSMVRVLPTDANYARTDKGTVIRQAFYRDFAQLIDEAYAIEEAVTGSLTLSEPELKMFIKEQLQQILPMKARAALTDESDFFGLGMDSLQAAQLRSVLVKTLNINGHQLGFNVAFEYPTINVLARHLDSLMSGSTDDGVSIEDKMKALISMYGQFEQHKPVSNGLSGGYVTVTGATGSLGSHVATRLSILPHIQKVYCLIRANSVIEAYDRLLKSLRTRRVYDTLPDSARNKLVALPSDLSSPTLGLDTTTYNILTSEITDIIHCAWSVNFNLHLTSFVKDSIAGLKNLLDLALKAQRPAPATLNFCSSVSAVVNTESDTVPEALPQNLSYAQEMGYAQSKLVGEHLCAKASQQTGIQARILRIGQVIGDTKHGIWNATEAIPLMLQCANIISALPALDESPLWLPVDVVADTVIDISLSLATGPSASPSNADSVFNILSNTPFHWTNDLLPQLRATGLSFETLPPREWISRLRSSNPDPAVNPPIKLVDFFAGKYDTDQPRRALKWETGEARRASAALEGETGLDGGLVRKMVDYFHGECW